MNWLGNEYQNRRRGTIIELGNRPFLMRKRVYVLLILVYFWIFWIRIQRFLLLFWKIPTERRWMLIIHLIGYPIFKKSYKKSERSVFTSCEFNAIILFVISPKVSSYFIWAILVSSSNSGFSFFDLCNLFNLASKSSLLLSNFFLIVCEQRINK